MTYVPQKRDEGPHEPVDPPAPYAAGHGVDTSIPDIDGRDHRGVVASTPAVDSNGRDTAEASSGVVRSSAPFCAVRTVQRRPHRPAPFRLAPAPDPGRMWEGVRPNAGLTPERVVHSDVDVLNYALTLEHLENAFYREGPKEFSDDEPMNADSLSKFGEELRMDVPEYLATAVPPPA